MDRRLPPRTPLDFVDDWRNTTRFMRGMKRWEPVEPERVQGAGTRFAVTMGAGPVNVGAEMEVTRHERPAHIEFRSTKGMRCTGSWTLTPSGKGTRVDLPGGIAGRVVRKVFESHAQKDIDGSLAHLKRLVEEAT